MNNRINYIFEAIHGNLLLSGNRKMKLIAWS
jgi:hypothetical protein